ncbi:MAG: S-methyl-5-thioribose-1-phosphate isomerase [Bacteroidota bacterium]
MKINGKHYYTIWMEDDDPSTVYIIDQRWLPHRFEVEAIRSTAEMARAIKEMHLRGAPLIGAAAAYGMYLATLEHSGDPIAELELLQAAEQLRATRPTAVNLTWALDEQLAALKAARSLEEQRAIARRTAQNIAADSVERCRSIGLHGLPIIEALAAKKPGQPVNILTHCNAGWLACIDYGTATSPIYHAHTKGIPVHVWVDETRPRNQGARITAWELLQEGVPHTVIPDNTGGHLMQSGMVDMVIVGSDRTTRCGDVANKIGTYLKALAAHDNQVPFYVALPSSTFDWTLCDGIADIPIEERAGREVSHIQGLKDGEVAEVLLTPTESPVVNYAFDVTPSRLVTALITERGVCAAQEEAILSLFPEKVLR